MSRVHKMSIAVALIASGLAPLRASADADKKTERMWKTKCAACHGADGRAQTEAGTKMGIADYSKAEWQKAHPDAELKAAIVGGVHLDTGGKKQEMDGYSDLAAAQVDSLVAYIRSFAK